MARPKKEQRDARAERLTVRLTFDERAQLGARADTAGLSPSEFARLAALGYRMDALPAASTPRPPGGEAASVPQIVALNRVGVNLNQIARALNAGVGFVPGDLADALARVNALLDDWQGVR